MAANDIWRTDRAPDLAEDIDILVYDLCVIWGFCNPLDVEALVEGPQPITPEMFARAVLLAEGMDPADDWKASIAAKFEARYGAAVSADTFSIA